jgi:hypothetical protein
MKRRHTTLTISKSDFAELCGVTVSAIQQAIQKRRVEINLDGTIDPRTPKNQKYKDSAIARKTKSAKGQIEVAKAAEKARLDYEKKYNLHINIAKDFTNQKSQEENEENDKSSVGLNQLKVDSKILQNIPENIENRASENGHLQENQFESEKTTCRQINGPRNTQKNIENNPDDFFNPVSTDTTDIPATYSTNSKPPNSYPAQHQNDPIQVKILPEKAPPEFGPPGDTSTDYSIEKIKAQTAWTNAKIAELTKALVRRDFIDQVFNHLGSVINDHLLTMGDRLAVEIAAQVFKITDVDSVNATKVIIDKDIQRSIEVLKRTIRDRYEERLINEPK